MPKRLKKILLAPFVLLLTLVVLVEDWLWDDLLRLATWLGQLPVLRQLERLIAGLPPYGALLIFAAPSLLLVPVKLAAFWFVAHGHASLGVATAIGAKVIGTALVARIYTLTEPKLLRIGWFAQLHERFLAFKHAVYTRLKATQLYQRVHAQKLALKIRWQHWRAQAKGGFLRSRWEAAQRLARRWRHKPNDSANHPAP